MYAHMPRCIQYKLVMCKMRFELGSNRVTSELTQTNWVLRCDFGYSAQPSNYLLWFCIPKWLQNVPKSAQIPKSCIWDIFSFLGLAIQFFFTVPSPNMGQILHPNLSTWLLEYLIPSTRILRGNWTKQIVESSSNPITRLPIDSKKHLSSHL